MGIKISLIVLTSRISYYVEKYDGDQMKFIGIASQLAITKAVSRRLSVNVLSLDIPTEDPMLVHIDQVDEKQQNIC